MEWRGINLTDFRVKRWRQNIYRQCYGLLSIGMAATGLAIYLQLSALQIADKNRPLISHNQQLKTELEQLNRKLKQGRNLSVTHTSETLTEKQVIAFLDLLQHLPLTQGGVDVVTLEYHDVPSMTVAGRLMESTQFEQLEKYLSEHKVFKFSLVNFQINEQNQVEFSLNIVLKE